MCQFLPDSPIAVKRFTIDEKRTIVERLRDNQTGVENKHMKAYQIGEAFLDVRSKLSLYYNSSSNLFYSTKPIFNFSSL